MESNGTETSISLPILCEIVLIIICIHVAYYSRSRRFNGLLRRLLNCSRSAAVSDAKQQSHTHIMCKLLLQQGIRFLFVQFEHLFLNVTHDWNKAVCDPIIRDGNDSSCCPASRPLGFRWFHFINTKSFFVRHKNTFGFGCRLKTR